MRRSTFALGCAAALAFVVVGAAHGAEPVKIRASWVVAPSDWTPLLLEKPDLMKDQGKSYVFEPMCFEGTPAVITALANNELELGNLAFSSLALAIQNAGLEDLRIVGDQFKDGAEGHYTNQFFVLKDSPVQKVADLKGRIVATNAAGSAVDIAMRAMLRKHGLEDKRDYTMIEAPFPTMKAMLVQKKADLAPFVAPFSFDPELKQIGRPLFAQKDAIGTTQMIVWVARKGFLEKNRAAMVDFMEDSLRVVRWYLDPKNHGEAAQIAARVTKQPPERFTGWLFTADKDYARSPDLLPDLAALQANIEVQRDLGFLKGPIDVQKYVDLSIVREAATRLK
jgi:ABC-type nitrate/sulfonate/bicarbonate transport system substrate-binding protein